MTSSPFGTPPATRHLARAPLDLVIAQVQFPAILSIDGGGDLVGPFQELIRDSYPGVEVTIEVPLAVVGGAAAATLGAEAAPAKVWRFVGREDGWQIALARNFIALSTTAYTERADLIQRLGTAMEALSSTIRPAVCRRVGVRYASRITAAEDIARLADLVNREIAGALTVPLPENVEPFHTITDALYRLPDASLRARWGRLPPNAILDITVPAVPSPSFLIDIDVFDERERDFVPEEIIERVRTLCDRQYAFFRWAVTDEYLRTYEEARP